MNNLFHRGIIFIHSSKGKFHIEIRLNKVRHVFTTLYYQLSNI